MKRNSLLIMYLLLLVLFVFIAAWLKWCHHPEAAKFILSAMTALGTCGVVCFTVWPYKPQDNLTAFLYYEPEDNPYIYKIRVINNTYHTICLGLRKDYAPYPDNLFIWWPKGVEQTYEKARTIWFGPEFVFSIPPKSESFYFLEKSKFADTDMKNIRMKVLTNSGYKCDVVNML